MLRRVLWLMAGLAGAAVAVLGCGLGALALVVGPAGGGTAAASDTMAAAGAVALSLGLAVPLAIQGWSGWRGVPSRAFSPGRSWWLWLLLLAALVVGRLVSTRSPASALLLPPIHVVTMVLPPLIVLWLVGRALRGREGSWREIIAGMGGGGFVGVLLALIGEGIAILALVALATGALVALPGGLERVTALARDLQDPAMVQDTANLTSLLLNPGIAVAALAMVAVVVPLIEEGCKILAAGLVAGWVRPLPARAFLWGVAGGAGFALVENMFNGALGGADGWAFGAVARLGATVMHCATGGLMGWAWGQLWTGRRPWRLLGCFAAAVAIHALWNAAAGGALLLGAVMAAQDSEPVWQGAAGLALAALAVLLTSVAVAFLLGLVSAARRLAKAAEQALPAQTAPPEATPDLETS